MISILSNTRQLSDDVLDYLYIRADMSDRMKKALEDFSNDMEQAYLFARALERNSEGNLSDNDLMMFYNKYRSKRGSIGYGD